MTSVARGTETFVSADEKAGVQLFVLMRRLGTSPPSSAPVPSTPSNLAGRILFARSGPSTLSLSELHLRPRRRAP